MGLAPYPWLERPAEVLAKMLNKLPGGILIYGPRGCGVFELASRFAAAVVCQHPSRPSLRLKRNRGGASPRTLER